ncbi:MAG: alkaline phosphatase D family protein, partial [Polaromonas sp.]|nr:alkaline phosphatase D family protein [Polaromonas sp.]
MMLRRDLLALGAAAALPSLHAGDAPLRRIGFASCIHQQRPQGLVDHLATQPFDLFLFGGDNVYAPRPYAREKLRAAYDQAAQHPGYTRLRQRVPHMAVWDDNDYDSADGGGNFAFREEAREEFLAFWQVPPDDPRRRQQGLYHARSFGPPGQRVQVILLDTRSF